MKKELNITPYENEMIEWLTSTRPTIFTILRHVSSSGMSRRIDVYAIRENRPVYLSGLCETLGIAKRHKNKQGLVVGGCGMDMGFHIVYGLGRAIFPDGFRLRENENGRNGDKSRIDKDGGYALRQEWI